MVRTRGRGSALVTLCYGYAVMFPALIVFFLLLSFLLQKKNYHIAMIGKLATKDAVDARRCKIVAADVQVLLFRSAFSLLARVTEVCPMGCFISTSTLRNASAHSICKTALSEDVRMEMRSSTFKVCSAGSCLSTAWRRPWSIPPCRKIGSKGGICEYPRMMGGHVSACVAVRRQRSMSALPSCRADRSSVHRTRRYLAGPSISTPRETSKEGAFPARAAEKASRIACRGCSK